MADSNFTTHRRSRAIASLTEEQAQHKRDIDRKAQRAFRQRTKDCIASLEEENTRLRETFSSREAELEQQIQLLREHNQALARTLGNILDLASTTLGVPCDGSVTIAGNMRAQLTPVSTCAHRSSKLTERHDEQPSHEDDRLRAVYSHDLSDAMDTAPATDHGEEPPAAIVSHEERGTEDAVASPTNNDMTNLAPVRNAVEEAAYVPSPPASDRPRSDQETLPSPATASLSPQFFVQEQNSQRHGCHNRFKDVPMCQPSVQSPHPAEPLHSNHKTTPPSQTTRAVEHVDQDLFQNNIAVTIPTPSGARNDAHSSLAETVEGYSNHAVYTVIPLFVSFVCPLDEILQNFLASRSAMLAEGVPLDSVVGPTRPSVKKLRNPRNVEPLHSLEALMSDILSTYLQVTMPQKMAFFWIMNQTMRWMISRTKESYTYMPSWLRPTATQITVPHAMWLTNIPWPGVRDLLVEQPEEYPYEVVGKWYTEHVSVNWNFDTLDAIDEIGGAERIHSIFEKHLRNLKNWTVSPAFLDRFPAMGPLIYG